MGSSPISAANYGQILTEVNEIKGGEQMPEEDTRKICFSLPPNDFLTLRKLLPHGTQDKLFATIAVALIPQLKEKKSFILGGIFSGDLKVELKLKGVDI